MLNLSIFYTYYYEIHNYSLLFNNILIISTNAFKNFYLLKK